ncbi:MAG: bifunctional MaoC family dehydratase N-terminal/OB-fold nucleic acid binding domain-containing protein [Myxococcota bacterium]
MNESEKKGFEAELRRFVGRPIGPPVTGRDPVNEPMIRQWCDAMGESSPVYLDPGAAKATAHGELKAPPTMLQAWVMEGWSMHEGYDEPRNEQHRLHKFLSDHGYTGVLGTNTEENYTRYLRLGERVTAETVIAEISDEKATGRGVGYFITTRTRFTNEQGESLGDMSFRVLRFKPPADAAAPSAATGKDGKSAAVAAKPTRIKPPLGQDNGWWWEKVAKEGVLPIQRCSGCGKLRHPPRPMCDACGSQEWDSIAASGRGTVHTFTVIHYPQFPGYEYPIVSIIVDLEEGERMASTLVDCKPDAVRIGMPVELVIHQDEDGFKIPFFRPAKGK